MKFTFTITKADSEQEPDKLVVKMAESEVAWHIALKLLGYLLFFDRKPQIEQDVGQHYRPDLFCWDEFQEKVALWIDCGNIAVKKIDKVATSMGKDREFYILRRTEYDAKNLAERIQKIKHPERVTIIAFEPEFVDRLAERIESTNEIEFSITNMEDHREMYQWALNLRINEQELSTIIIDVAGRYSCKS